MKLAVLKRKTSHFLKHTYHKFFHLFGAETQFRFDPAQPDYSKSLSPELWMDIFQLLDYPDLGNIAPVSRYFNTLIISQFKQCAYKENIASVIESLTPHELAIKLNQALEQKEAQRDLLIKLYPEWIIDLIGNIDKFHKIPEKKFNALPMWMSLQHIKSFFILRGIEGFGRAYMAFSLEETNLTTNMKKNRVFMLTFNKKNNFCSASFHRKNPQPHINPGAVGFTNYITFTSKPVPLLYQFIKSLCEYKSTAAINFRPLRLKENHMIQLDDQNDAQKLPAPR